MGEGNNYDCVADLYDTYVPVAFDVPFFVDATANVRGEVLELMAGTGRVSIPLLQAGARLTCVDVSRELNAVLRQKLARLGLHAEVLDLDVRQLDLGRQFESVIIPFHSFAHLTTPADQQETLRRIYQHLSPGGQFICTLTNPVLRRKSIDGTLKLYRRYPLEAGRGTLLLWILERIAPDDEQIVDALEFFEEYGPQGTLQAKRLLELRFRLTSKEEFEALAGAAGFTVEALYGDYTCAGFQPDSSPYLIWVMKKSG